MAETNLHRLEELANGHKPYREVQALEEAELIKIKRGKYNRILLDNHDKAVCEQFMSFSEKFESLPLAVSEFEKRQLESQKDRLEEKVQSRDKQIETLQNKLQVYRQPWYKKPLVWLKKGLKNWADKLPG